MEGADIDRGGGNRRIWENHQSKMGDYYPATSLDPRNNETWTVLKVLDRVYGQGYGRIGSDWVG